MSDGTKILVVDDDGFMRDLFGVVLGDDYQLLLAENGRDALAIAAATGGDGPDLILLDVELPDIDGYELCRQIRRIEGCADIPVVFVSGHEDSEGRVRGYEAGGDDYVAKPFEQQELLDKIARLMRSTVERRRI